LSKPLNKRSLSQQLPSNYKVIITPGLIERQIPCKKAQGVSKRSTFKAQAISAYRGFSLIIERGEAYGKCPDSLYEMRSLPGHI
jgi:hypothetical protein